MGHSVFDDLKEEVDETIDSLPIYFDDGLEAGMMRSKLESMKKKVLRLEEIYHGLVE